MTVDEAVRNLGKCIQADIRYKRYVEAKKANDENEELQNQINELQLEKMNYQRKAKKTEPNNEKMRKWEEELEEKFEAIIATDGMKEFQAAKLELDAMMRKIDAVISLSLSGEDPETCYTSIEKCSGNCADCSSDCH